MHLQRLEIEGLRGFGAHFEVELSGGLNVLVGENGAGKSAVIDAIRMILQADDYGRAGIRDSDFHRPFTPGAEPFEWISIRAHFGALSPMEQIAFLPWTNADDTALLTLRAENKKTARDRFKRTLWGGASSSPLFEWELMETIDCVYLPPLRDAEARLREGRGSRLARLLKNLHRRALEEAEKADEAHPLVEKFQSFQSGIADDEKSPPTQANKLIRESLRSAVGDLFGQETSVQFSETSFDRIVESLRLLFHPDADPTTSAELFRGLEENSLGYNNLLYLATVLAELSQPPVEADKDARRLRLLLIEEPEAHVHPQLQVRLLKYLEQQAGNAGFQVIVTTHSPVLASAVSMGSLIHMSRDDEGSRAVRLSQCGLSEPSSAFVSRWLDVTKSTLLFARGVILVEGIAEALLLPELARRVLVEYNAAAPESKLPESLADAGVSVINMNGVYFQHFLPLFSEALGATKQHLPVQCAGITDRDPDKEKPTASCPGREKNAALELAEKVNASVSCRLYHGALKTLEYDLAMEEGNLSVMLAALCDVKGGPPPKGPCPCVNNWAEEEDEAKASEALRLYKSIKRSDVTKGYYAQRLADKLAPPSDCPFAVPEYIKRAVLWAMGADDE